MVRAEVESVDYQLHRRADWIDPLLLRNVLLENVVLQGARNPFPIGPLFFGNYQVHCQEYRSRRIDRLRNRYILQWNAFKQDLHVRERRDGHATLADFAL